MNWYALLFVYICSIGISFYLTRSYSTLRYKRRGVYEDTADYVLLGVICFIPALNLIFSIIDIVEEKQNHQEPKAKRISMFKLFMRNCFVHNTKEK